jgi:hypothetical protein
VVADSIAIIVINESPGLEFLELIHGSTKLCGQARSDSSRRWQGEEYHVAINEAGQTAHIAQKVEP